MATSAVPSLSLAGFITDIASAVDRMLAYYLTSEYSQSNEFPGRVLSLQKQIQAYQHDDNTLRTKVREELEGYFASISDASTIDVSTDRPNPDDPNRINLTVSATIVKDGQSYSVGKLIETRNSITLNIFNLNNQGTAA